MNRLDVSHGAVERVEAAAASAVVSAEQHHQREDRRRAQVLLHADLPSHVIARAHLGLDEAGGLTQVFSGADCGCSKPADFSGIVGPLIIEGTSPSSPYATLLPERQTMSIGKNPASDAAAQLARRVDRSRATFAAKKTAPIVAFSEAGAILGIVAPDKVQRPDGKQTLAIFDQAGQFVGLAKASDVQAVATAEPVGRPSRGVAEAPPQSITPSPQMAALKRAGFR